MTRSLFALALALPLALGSCVIIGSNSHSKEEGRYVSDKTLEQVEPGSNGEYVIALLGEPSTRTTLSDGVTIWKWGYTRTTTQKSHLLFVLSANSSKEMTRCVYVQLDADGLVERVWHD